MEILLEYLAKGFMVMLYISMPCVLVAAAVGLVIGIVQAVTQVQEQTIAAAPKILAVFLVIIIGGMGFIKLLTNLFDEGMSIAFNVVSKSDNYALGSDYYKYTTPFQGDISDKYQQNLRIKNIINKPSDAPLGSSHENQKYLSAPKSATPTPNLIETNKIIGR